MPTWTKEQNDAILKDKSNIIVSAGAGSGKTAVLSERVIRKLKEGVHINELLLLTFTNAAAKEMKERIRKKIKKEGLTKELEMIDQAYITTFDSYALSIVKKYNYEIDIYKISGKEIKLTSHGIQAHGAHPDLGLNAISQLLIATTQILKRYNVSIELFNFFNN